MNNVDVAIMCKEVTYFDGEIMVNVLPGTYVVVDVDRGIAVHNNRHFTVFVTDYILEPILRYGTC